MKSSLLLPLLVSLGAAPAFGASKGGVSLPDQVKVGEKTLSLNGLGIREATIFNVKVYVAGLYLEKKSGDPQAIIQSEEAKQIIMHFVRDVDLEDIVDAYRQGFENNLGEKGAAALKPKIDKLMSMMAAMKVGDKLVLTQVPGEGIQVTVKGKQVGVVPGSDFTRAVWSLFIGKEPPNRSLKDGLLGKE